MSLIKYRELSQKAFDLYHQHKNKTVKSANYFVKIVGVDKDEFPTLLVGVVVDEKGRPRKDLGSNEQFLTGDYWIHSSYLNKEYSFTWIGKDRCKSIQK